ncbi:colicin transporter [Pseudoscardovia radai]|uniref:Colicin transporter n=1 Tax=Pseudoscardovia radai TaxID=987066 RepID=A0A261ER82_9BIFI|nr:hypothetical protein [Pseudoscardovia radai]OZG49359.1 colicin transporter [Pseudoscardovia radai]
MSTNTNTPVAPDPAKKSKKKRTAIIGACAVIALVAAGAGIGIHAHRTGTAQAEAEDARQTAYTACQQASDGARASLDAYQKAIADSEDTTKIDPATLADSTTLDTLNTARTSPASKPAACDTTMDKDTLGTLTQAWKDAGNTWDKATGDVTAAAQAVTDSQTKKTLDDANTALDQQLTDGRALLGSSDGQVADAQTRFDLTDAINQGQALRDSNSTDANAINAAAGAIYNASVKVNDSIGRKQADDAAAAQAAAQAEAQRQAQAQAQASKTTRSTTSGTTRTTTGGSTTTGTASSGSLPPSNAHNAQPDESFFFSFGGGCTSDCGTYDGWNHNTY